MAAKSQFVRVIDPEVVDAGEALDQFGSLRNGYGIRRSLTLMDAVQQRVHAASVGDRSGALKDAAVTARDAAYAERNQRYATGYLRDAAADASATVPAPVAQREPAHIVRDARAADSAEVSRLQGALVAAKHMRDERFRTAHQGGQHG